MWSYICYSQICFVLIYATQQRSSIEIKNYNRDERIFADVIRIISRVNNVLQELITNYEQLQKIYKSEENIEKDYSSDAEIDEKYKHIKSDKKNRVRGVNQFKEESKELDYFPATQIIWSGDDGTNNDDDTYEESQKNIVGKSKPIQSKTSIKSISAKEYTSAEFKEIKEYEIKNTPKRDNILLHDMHNKNTAAGKNETNSGAINMRPKKRFTWKVSKKPVTKIKIKKETRNYNNINGNYAIKQNNAIKKTKRIIYAEAFSPKTIWNEIIQNKPIKLKAQEETIYDRNEHKKLINLDPNLRSVEGKTAIVSLTENKKTDKQESSQSTEDEEIVKTNVLRKAYGDACLKVVVKKCYKACKHVNKAVCVRHSCKSKFKEKFKESSKTGCVKEFWPVSVNNKTTSTETRTNSKFNDVTRVGLLAMCHLNEPDTKLRMLKNDTTATSAIPATNHYKELHILRDRYERACRRVSTSKCVSACNYASKSTCDTFVCAKSLKQSYKKYCKKQCRIVYGSKHGKSSSKSSTSGDTDSNSADTSFSYG